MTSDVEVLSSLNVEIGEAEARGDSAFFDQVLAPAFALRGADGVRMDTRERFIASVELSGSRATEVESVTFFGADRAVVTCIVVLEQDGRSMRFHGVRLFTRRSGGNPWKLLAWANARLT